MLIRSTPLLVIHNTESEGSLVLEPVASLSLMKKVLAGPTSIFDFCSDLYLPVLHAGFKLSFYYLHVSVNSVNLKILVLFHQSRKRVP